jgi:hypothetical protein
MRNYGPQLFFFLLALVLAGAITLACGSSPRPSPITGCSPFVIGPNTTGTLESVSLCPSVADAENYPGGEVQFTPSGVYNTAPTLVTPLKTTEWGACQGNTPTDDVIVSSTGAAKCAAGASGVYSVYTSVPTACEHIGPCGTGCNVSGYAQLTCP